MTPTEFFDAAASGSCIRYGDTAFPIDVRIGFISRNSTPKYAHGVEKGTERKVFLTLERGLLKDAHRGCFDAVEIVR